LVRDADTRIQQKERQIEYLDELKLMAQQKYHDAAGELEETRCDMITIIEQLKIK
jgi:predicted RecB family endonuclease